MHFMGSQMCVFMGGIGEKSTYKQRLPMQAFALIYTQTGSTLYLGFFVFSAIRSAANFCSQADILCELGACLGVIRRRHWVV